jgi:uncharacterized lipoprotein YehR (DUF1307 family)
MTTMMKSVFAALAIVGALSLAACDQKQESSTSGSSTGTTDTQTGTTGTTDTQSGTSGTTPPASGESGTTTTQ